MSRTQLITHILLLAALSLCACQPKTELSIESETEEFMAFSGSSTASRPDWVFPIDRDTLLTIRMGMTSHNYGGGIPCTVVWTKDECIAVGSLSPYPLDLNIPIERKGNKVRVWIEAGAEGEMPEVFIYKGKGDCFEALRAYAKAMEKRGIKPAEHNPAALETQWCGWGYRESFTPEEILATLPKIKELGIEWVCIDDGFQAYRAGAKDWVPAHFEPGTMRALADSIHAAGLKAMIWWYPMSTMKGSSLYAEHPEVTALGLNGEELLLGHGAQYLYPTHETALAQARETVRMFIEDWDYDGLKLDGHHMNCFPPSAQHPEDPNYDAHNIACFYKAIYDEAQAIKPESVVQYCPCGCVFSIYHLPYTNQTVSSDPKSSYQVRTKGYVLKAVAPNTPYYGDHLELIQESDGAASQLGIGAVPGTKFTWPKDNPKVEPEGSSLLTARKEEIYKKTFDLYYAERQSEGELLGGLYKLGFHYPEAYAIKKADGSLYYSFFAPDFTGTVELRGLKAATTYKAVNLWNSQDLGTFSKHQNQIELSFQNFMLLKLTPIQ